MFSVLDSNDNGCPMVQVIGLENFDPFYTELKELLSKHRVRMIAEDIGMTLEDGESSHKAKIQFTQYGGSGAYDTENITFIAEAVGMWPDNAEFNNDD